jgi:hypothetical protein
MIIYDFVEKVNVESLNSIISKLESKIDEYYIEFEKRYEFNLGERDDVLYNLKGHEIRVKYSDNTQKFCFRPLYQIKSECQNILYDYYNLVEIEKRQLNYDNYTVSNFDIIATDYYKKVNLPYICEHVKVVAKFNDIIVEVPQIGISCDGLPFTLNNIDEIQSSGWWISGTAVYVFMNGDVNNLIPIEIKVFYEDKVEEE